MIDIRFTDEMNPRNAARVIDHLRQPRAYIDTAADYGAAHEAWLGKIEAELVSATRFALMATDGRETAGVIVFRPEPNKPETIGIRNISIKPAHKGQLFGSFALRTTERIASTLQPAARQIIVDTKTTNRDMIGFLHSQGYADLETTDLYDSGKPDLVLAKDLSAITARNR